MDPESLFYPLQSPPAPGETVEAAPGVLWLRMPLPMALNHINLWALADRGSWTVVDIPAFRRPRLRRRGRAPSQVRSVAALSGA